MAKLYFRYGVMGAGKSTSLMGVVESYQRQSRGTKNYYVLKPEKDTKASEVVSRLGVTWDVDIHVTEEQNLYETLHVLRQRNPHLKCVVVDEAQFLEPHHINELFMVALDLDIPVICYGLRSDFSTNMFPASARLFALAHNIEKVKTICGLDTCDSGKEATFNARRELGGDFISDGPQVAIDDGKTVEYVALCPQCYIKNVKRLC